MDLNVVLEETLKRVDAKLNREYELQRRSLEMEAVIRKLDDTKKSYYEGRMQNLQQYAQHCHNQRGRAQLEKHFRAQLRKAEIKLHEVTKRDLARDLGGSKMTELPPIAIDRQRYTFPKPKDREGTMEELRKILYQPKEKSRITSKMVRKTFPEVFRKPPRVEGYRPFRRPAMPPNKFADRKFAEFHLNDRWLDTSMKDLKSKKSDICIKNIKRWLQSCMGIMRAHPERVSRDLPRWLEEGMLYIPDAYSASSRKDLRDWIEISKSYLKRGDPEIWKMGVQDWLYASMYAIQELLLKPTEGPKVSLEVKEPPPNEKIRASIRKVQEWRDAWKSAV
uniref:Uncharacterized protein n=1 Tax=Sphaerodactylus townsendi TaxID=933632 RepID=A0ACB8FUJ4_9SAUR